MIRVVRSDCVDHPDKKEEKGSSTMIEMTYIISMANINHMKISMTI